MTTLIVLLCVLFALPAIAATALAFYHGMTHDDGDHIVGDYPAVPRDHKESKP